MSISVHAPRVVGDEVAHSTAGNALFVVGGSALIGLAAQVSVHLPGNPVPITGQTFAVLLVAAAGGLLRGVVSTMLYAVLGLLGVPWFAAGSSGYLTATFGYILGFVLAAAVVGRLAQSGWTRTPWGTLAAMLVGSAVIYAVGVPWLKLALGLTWSRAIDLGMAPFLVGDLLKAGLAAGLFTAAWAAIDRRRRPDA